MSKIEESQKLASDKNEALKIAEKFSAKKEEKKEEKKAESKAEQKAEPKAQIELKADFFEISELKISKWGDLLFSKAIKELAKLDLSLKSECDYLFAIDSEKKQISFRLKQESDKIEDNNYLCFFRKRIASFYHKKDARAKLESQLKINIAEQKFRIRFNKNCSGIIFLQ
jgi:hypothetical protein